VCVNLRVFVYCHTAAIKNAQSESAWCACACMFFFACVLSYGCCRQWIDCECV